MFSNDKDCLMGPYAESQKSVSPKCRPYWTQTLVDDPEWQGNECTLDTLRKQLAAAVKTLANLRAKCEGKMFTYVNSPNRLPCLSNHGFYSNIL